MNQTDSKLLLIKLYGEKNAAIGQYSLRQGVYTITEINNMVVSSRVEQLLVSAAWKPDESFQESLLVLVQLSPIYNKNSKGCKELNPIGLLGATIKIDHIEKINASYQGRDYVTTQVVWTIVNFPGENPCYNEPIVPPVKPTHLAIAGFQSYHDEEALLISMGY